MFLLRCVKGVVYSRNIENWDAKREGRMSEWVIWSRLKHVGEKKSRCEFFKWLENLIEMIGLSRKGEIE